MHFSALPKTKKNLILRQSDLDRARVSAHVCDGAARLWLRRKVEFPRLSERERFLQANIGPYVQVRTTASILSTRLDNAK